MRKSIVLNHQSNLKKKVQQLQSYNKSKAKLQTRPKLTRIQRPITRQKSLKEKRNIQKFKQANLRQIKVLQKDSEFMIPKASFCRLVRQIDTQVSEDHHYWTQDAMNALQYAAQDYMTGLFEDAYLCSQHCNRVTLMLKDIRLARRIRGRADPGNR